MKILTTTEARKQLPALIHSVYYTKHPIIIGHRQRAEVMMVRFPDTTNNQLSEITNINQYSGSFDWLDDEPELYSRQDLKKSYV